MTIKELKEKLDKYPDNLSVYFCTSVDDTYHNIHGTTLNHEDSDNSIIIY